MKKQLERNIWIDYIFSFCRNFDVASAVWVLYMGYRGLSLWQIGIVEGIFHMASFLFEVPSGALADLAGRKKVMILGRVSSMVSSVILLFSTELWQFILGFVIGALGYNLNSGSEEALVYDSLKHIGEEGRYIKENPAVLKILLYYPMVEAFYTVVFFYGQQYFSDFGFSRIQISLLMLAVGVLSCLGALSSDKVLQIFGEKTKYVVSFAMGISILFVSRKRLMIAVIAFLIAGYVNSLIYPIALASLNELIPSEHRATIISVDSMFFSLAMICFFRQWDGLPESGNLAAPSFCWERWQF